MSAGEYEGCILYGIRQKGYCDMEKWARINYQPNLPLGENGERVTASAAHILLSKEAAKEGMVLLKNEQETLPLAAGTKVALFGKASFDYVKGGGGSGDVTVSYIRTLYDGLKQKSGKISVFEPLSEFYRENVKEQYAAGRMPGMTVEPELPPELLKKARAYTDTAIITVSRFSGEGWDRNTVIDPGNKNIDAQELYFAKLSSELFKRSDFYLTEGEEAMVLAVAAAFEKVIVVMNVGGMVDTGWFRENDRIQAVLMAWQGGIEGGLAAAELLLGEGNPSGKLCDTFAGTLEDYPSTENFHESFQYVDYTEDIYVGYRYFLTIPGAAQKVNYPFGYGLSYTKFEISGRGLTVQSGGNKNARAGDTITVSADVTNTGKAAGKEVVQVYFQAPQGRLGKPMRQLIAFEKTRLLAPGETQRITLCFHVKSMASYDDLGKVQKSAWILEAGEYCFYLGNSSVSAELLPYKYILDENLVTEQLTQKLAPTSLKQRMLADGSYEALPQSAPIDPNEDALEHLPVRSANLFAPGTRARAPYLIWAQEEDSKHLLKEVADGTVSMEEFLAQLTDEELAHLLGGQPNVGVANTFGFGNLPEYGIPNAMTADGPAGLRILPECGVCTTAWPCATLLASSWNLELVEAVGAAGGREVKENNIAVWLTPAVNIHRSPLCGRNFEYYSEDPYLSGKMAAAMIRGIQSNHIGCSMKHFALNNKETNRKNCDSRASERAIREIYLKAFEIAVKEADPWTIMSSYNIINGRRSSENRELLTDILRDEWGFKGMVTTDWWTDGEHYKETKAGNDIKMGSGFPQRLLEARKLGVLSREEMEQCVRRLLELLIKID